MAETQLTPGASPPPVQDGPSADKGKVSAQESLGEDLPPDAIAESEEDDEPSCSICLQPFLNRTSVSPCFHSFCFHCICQWAELSRKCPECRQQFTFAVVHGTGEDDHEKHEFLEIPTQDTPYVFARPERLTLHRYRQVYGGTPRPARTWGRPSTDRMESPDMVRRDAAEAKRRYIYRHGLRAKHTGVNRNSKCKEVTPAEFKRNPGLLRKLEPWIRRDLQAILRTDDVEIIKAAVIGLLSREHPRTDTAIDFLKDYLFEHSEHFLHELICFAKSPLNMEVYDATVQYDLPAEDARTDGNAVSSRTTGHRNTDLDDERARRHASVITGSCERDKDDERVRQRMSGATSGRESDKDDERVGWRTRQTRNDRKRARSSGTDTDLGPSRRKRSRKEAKKIRKSGSPLVGSAADADRGREKSAAGYDEYGDEVNFDYTGDDEIELAQKQTKRESAAPVRSQGPTAADVQSSEMKPKPQEFSWKTEIRESPTIKGDSRKGMLLQLKAEISQTSKVDGGAGIKNGVNVELIKARLKAMKGQYYYPRG